MSRDLNHMPEISRAMLSLNVFLISLVMKSTLVKNPNSLNRTRKNLLDNILKDVSVMKYNNTFLEFDHNTSSTEQFNNELSILVNHFKLVSDDKKLNQDLIAQMTYIVELLHKNQVAKNSQTKARVK